MNKNAVHQNLFNINDELAIFVKFNKLVRLVISPDKS